MRLRCVVVVGLVKGSREERGEAQVVDAEKEIRLLR